MKAAFGAEAIGYGNEITFRREMGTFAGLVRSDMPWVAEITGPDSRYTYARSFLGHKADWGLANSKGTRGVWFWWTLESGRFYQARYRTTWDGGFHQRFLRVTDAGDIKEISEEGVRTWVSAGSA